MTKNKYDDMLEKFTDDVIHSKNDVSKETETLRETIEDLEKE